MRYLKGIIVLIVIISSISGCVGNPLAGLGLDTDTPKFWAIYNRMKAETDALAAAGDITWVQASAKVRDADKRLAENKSGFDTSWKFDSDDEEYHSYVIAIAERLDQKLISFAEFDASRIAKRNEIDARRQYINQQSRPAPSSSLIQQGAQLRCMLKGKVSAGMGTHCVYDCVGSEVIQTIGPAQICQIQISR